MLHAYVDKNCKFDTQIYRLFDLGNKKYCVLLKEEDVSLGEIKLRKHTHPDFWHMTVLEAEWWVDNVIKEVLNNIRDDK